MGQFSEPGRFCLVVDKPEARSFTCGTGDGGLAMTPTPRPPDFCSRSATPPPDTTQRRRESPGVPVWREPWAGKASGEGECESVSEFPGATLVPVERQQQKKYFERQSLWSILLEKYNF